MEAFSDIVIGFSLAQVGLSLSPATFFTHRAGLIAFVITFLGVSTIWWSHNRLFAKYFVPNRLNIILNFVALGCMVLFVFSIQMLISARDLRALPFYLAMYGIVYLLLGSLYIGGAVERRAKLSEDDYSAGIRRGVRTCIIATGMLLAVVVLSLTGAKEERFNLAIFATVALTAAAVKITERIFPVLRKPKRPRA